MNYLHKQKFLLEGLVFHPKYSCDNGDFPFLLRVFSMMYFKYLNKFHAINLRSFHKLLCSFMSSKYLNILIISVHLHQHDNLKYSFLNKSF